jgi:hypothetical protein
MNGNTVLYIDQYGTPWFARSPAELKRKLGGGRVAKVYTNKKDGRVVHVGYAVGDHWCIAYVPYEGEA